MAQNNKTVLQDGRTLGPGLNALKMKMTGGLKFTEQSKWIFALCLMMVLVRLVFMVIFELTKEEAGSGFLVRLYNNILFLVVLLLLWAVLRKFRHWPYMVLFVAGPFLGFLADNIHTIFFATLVYGTPFHFLEIWGLKGYIYGHYLGSLPFFSWFLGFMFVTIYFDFRDEKLKVLKAESQSKHARLHMLRQQIDPHFLFNTLNSISSLILDEKNKKAEEMLSALSGFLRSSLTKPDIVKVTLREEIETIDKYLSIEKIRYSDRLEVDYQVESQTLECLVPFLLLQPAVENAIKHAIGPMRSGGMITIATSIEHKELRISVSDNGPGLLTEKKKDGIGLLNMRRRLSVLYGSNSAVTVANRPQGGAEVMIALPVEFSAPPPRLGA